MTSDEFDRLVLDGGFCLSCKGQGSINRGEWTETCAICKGTGVYPKKTRTSKGKP